MAVPPAVLPILFLTPLSTVLSRDDLTALVPRLKNPLPALCMLRPPCLSDLPRVIREPLVAVSPASVAVLVAPAPASPASEPPPKKPLTLLPRPPACLGPVPPAFSTVDARSAPCLPPLRLILPNLVFLRRLPALLAPGLRPYPNSLRPKPPAPIPPTILAVAPKTGWSLNIKLPAFLITSVNSLVRVWLRSC